MNHKLSVTLVAVAMASLGIVGTAHATIPGTTDNACTPRAGYSDGCNWIGPRPQDSCAVSQALGYGGDPAGTSGLGALGVDVLHVSERGYHSYTNTRVLAGLDACADAGSIPTFAGCVIVTQSAADDAGIATILADPTDPGHITQGVTYITDPSLGSGNLFQTACNGLAGSGTDGEFEWGSNSAILNTRGGCGTEPAPGTNCGGDGVGTCFSSQASSPPSGHHGPDSTIFVADLVSGGAVGFTVSRDWARWGDGAGGTGQSGGLGLDENTDPNLSARCGDGAVEPCTVTPDEYNFRTFNGLIYPAGVANDATTYPDRLPGDNMYLADAALSSQASSHETAIYNDIQNGCNPLDASVIVYSAGVGSGVNSWTPDTTLDNFAGADGFITVAIHGGTATVEVTEDLCYDLPILGNEGGHCTGAVGNGDVSTDHTTGTSIPTVGWVWTGNPLPFTYRCTPGPNGYGVEITISGPPGSTVSCEADCFDHSLTYADWASGTGNLVTTFTPTTASCTPVSGPTTATANSGHPHDSVFSTMPSVGTFVCTMTISGGFGITSGHGGCIDP